MFCDIFINLYDLGFAELRSKAINNIASSSKQYDYVFLDAIPNNNCVHERQSKDRYR
jgi:hypothetical protein